MTDVKETTEFGPLERLLLNEFQCDFPLTPHPFAEIARRIDSDEKTVLDMLGRLSADGVISRIGPVYAPHRAGTSTLAALEVPADRVEEVACTVGEYSQVNHNYERENRFNLWFVVTAADDAALHDVLGEIERRCGLPVLELPLLEAYHINLGFTLQWT